MKNIDEVPAPGIRFGHLDEPTGLSWSAGSIKPLSDHADIVNQVQSHNQACDGWFYPPFGPACNSSGKDGSPLVPKGFSLPSTHELHLTGPLTNWTEECANFFICLFGLLKGRRLQREGWQHFYKAPLKRALCDFYADNREITTAMEKATKFWLTHTEVGIRKLTFGALHWHLFAQLYEHEFERFNAQYTAIDTCYKMAQKTWPGFPSNGIPHAKRAVALCTHLEVPAPAWVIIPSGQKTCELADRRNALIHEAMYGGKPVGFAYPQDNGAMELGLKGLVGRILLSLLGIDNEYTRSQCTTRQTIGFAF